MKIRMKLIIGMGILMIIMMGSLVVSYSSSTKMQASYEEIIKNNENIRYDIKAIQFRLAGISNDERGFLLTGDRNFPQEMKDKKADVSKYISAIKQLEMNDDDKKMLDAIEGNYNVFLKTSNQVIDQYLQGNRNEANQIHFTEERTARKSLDPLVDKFLTQKEKDLELDLDKLTQNLTKNHILIISMGVLFIFLSLLTGITLIGVIVKPIRRVSNQLKEIAEGEGDLTQQIEVRSKDEVGELATSFNQMVCNLRSLIQQVKLASNHVAASSDELNASAEQSSKATEQITIAIQEIALGADHQVSLAIETNNVVTKIAKGMERVNQSIRAVSDSSVVANKRVDVGTQIVSQTIKQMNRVQETSGETALVIHALGNKSKEIGQIVELINGIANQTNLLALNAAIEAARAGEHGKGFAVVADEVRKLAEESRKATEEIAKLIRTIQDESQKAVDSMNQGTAVVQEGIQRVHQTGDAFEDIAKAITDILSQSQEGATIVEQVNVSSKQMVQLVESVAIISQQASGNTQNVVASAEEQNASIEEITSSSESLSKMAAELQWLIGKFKV
ncbi:MAG TPA: methyl-accepting chemotaxis protein [Bacillota bacterium]|nr:methyl-accepting chemotaxis protein [Bacillota bacterium]